MELGSEGGDLGAVGAQEERGDEERLSKPDESFNGCGERDQPKGSLVA